MTILYKLTDQDGWTRRDKTNACLWGPGITHSGTSKGELCSDGYIHAYTDSLLAGLFNPIHANLNDPCLWRAEGDIALSDHGLKVGCVSLMTVEKMTVPKINILQKVRFSILCSLEVYDDIDWRLWAEKWLSGKIYIYNNIRYICGKVPTGASETMVLAARAAMWSTQAAHTLIDYDTAWTAETGMVAANAARWATEAAATNTQYLDLIKFAHQAVSEEK